MATDSDTTARAILECVCEATVGPPVVALCCECDTNTTGDLTIHFERLYDADPSTLEQVSRVHPCRNSTMVADFSLVLTRCYPMLDEQGNMPDSDTQDIAATDMHADIQTVFKALTCGCVESSFILGEIAVDAMPDSGCMVLAVRVSTEVSMKTVPVGS
jgi:hypothetical protein